MSLHRTLRLHRGARHVLTTNYRSNRSIDEGADRSDLAVLTRWNRRLAALERDCLRAGLACETSQSEALLDTPPAQKLHALLRVVDARRRGRPLDAPMTELLSHLLPDNAMARLRDFGERAMPDAALWTAFQTVVSNERARRSAGLDSATDRLDQTYATVTNLLQNTQEDGLTIGAFTREALSQLGDPLQLLRRYTDTLTDPVSLPSLQHAGTVLGRWRDSQRRETGAPPRLLLHHRTPQITRLWRQLVRRALGLETDPLAPLPEMQEALFARPTDEGIPPLGADDVVLTNDLEALLRWAERTGDLSDSADTPQILLLAPDGALPSGQKTLLEVDPDDVHVVDSESTFHSPSVRLFKLLQTTSGPSAPEPLFPEYVMVDLEATSTDPRHCCVAEIGALKVRDGAVVDRFSQLVQLPEDLTADERETLRTVCGLDPASDFDEARPEAAVWADFCAFVDGAPLVAHNGQRYDFRVRRRRLAHEPLLPLLVAALTYDSPAPEALSDDARVFLQVGHTWALRDASPAGDDLRSLLPRALPDRLRQHALYTLIDEEALLTASADLQPGLARRLAALFAPYADRPLRSEALADLLAHLALWGEETTPQGEDVITLSTYHSAKGLEFERVVCMDVHDNAFPPYFARDPEERRESRRLLYVGMTRAERHLVLTYPKRERGYDRRPTAFLDAAPDELLQVTDAAP